MENPSSRLESRLWSAPGWPQPWGPWVLGGTESRAGGWVSGVGVMFILSSLFCCCCWNPPGIPEVGPSPLKWSSRPSPHRLDPEGWLGLRLTCRLSLPLQRPAPCCPLRTWLPNSLVTFAEGVLGAGCALGA